MGQSKFNSMASAMKLAQEVFDSVRAQRPETHGLLDDDAEHGFDQSQEISDLVMEALAAKANSFQEYLALVINIAGPEAVPQLVERYVRDIDWETEYLAEEAKRANDENEGYLYPDPDEIEAEDEEIPPAMDLDSVLAILKTVRKLRGVGDFERACKLLWTMGEADFPEDLKFSMSHGVMGDRGTFWFYVDHDWGNEYGSMFVQDAIDGIEAYVANQPSLADALNAKKTI